MCWRFIIFMVCHLPVVNKQFWNNLRNFYRNFSASVFCMNFVDISYNNCHTRRLYVAAAYLCLKYKFILVCGMSFSDWWVHWLVQSVTEFVTLTALRKLVSIFLQLTKSNQVKFFREIMLCQGYFLKIALGMRVKNRKKKTVCKF